MMDYICIMAFALFVYRLDQKRREKEGDDKRGLPWTWEDLL